MMARHFRHTFSPLLRRLGEMQHVKRFGLKSIGAMIYVATSPHHRRETEGCLHHFLIPVILIAPISIILAPQPAAILFISFRSSDCVAKRFLSGRKINSGSGINCLFDYGNYKLSRNAAN